MTKNALTALVNYLNGATIDNLDEIKAELEKELNRNAERAAANRAMYENAKSIVFEGLRIASNPVTIAELYAEVKDKLPDGFSKSKVQYGITRLWSNEIQKIEGKTNTYTLKVA